MLSSATRSDWIAQAYIPYLFVLQSGLESSVCTTMPLPPLFFNAPVSSSGPSTFDSGVKKMGILQWKQIYSGPEYELRQRRIMQTSDLTYPGCSVYIPYTTCSVQTNSIRRTTEPLGRYQSILPIHNGRCSRIGIGKICRPAGGTGDLPSLATARVRSATTTTGFHVTFGYRRC
jgi:hypothetical protein